MTASGFYHCSVKGVGRAKGRSIVAAAAYRSGERLADEITGQTFDYRARSGVIDSFILAPDNAPAWAHERAQLWNEAERTEDRANGRLATELELALPHELDAAQRKQLLKDYLAPIIERHGVAVDVAIHQPGEGRDHRNIHAHVLVTHRELGPDGFGEIANTRTMTRKRKGQEVQEKIAGIAATPADIKVIREGWEHAVNRAYERAGLDIRADHRSHEDRGIPQEPSTHLGPDASAMERRGLETDRGNVNREITQRNADRQTVVALEAEERILTAQIIDLNAERERRYGPLQETHRQVQGQQFEGRYDELRAAEPPPEIVNVFAAGAARTAEPAAPNFDRDAAEADWSEKLTAAAIANDAAKPPEGGIPTYRTPSENAPAPTAARQNVAPEPETGKTEDLRPLGHTAGENAAEAVPQNDLAEGRRELHSAVAIAEHAVHKTFSVPAAAIDAALDVASGFFGGAAKIVSGFIGALSSFFGDSGPKQTRQQVHDKAQAAGNLETLHAVAHAEAVQVKEAARDEQIFRADQETQLPLAAPSYFRAITRPANPADRERDDDREREIERER